MLDEFSGKTKLVLWLTPSPRTQISEKFKWSRLEPFARSKTPEEKNSRLAPWEVQHARVNDEENQAGAPR